MPAAVYFCPWRPLLLHHHLDRSVTTKLPILTRFSWIKRESNKIGGNPKEEEEKKQCKPAMIKEWTAMSKNASAACW